MDPGGDVGAPDDPHRLLPLALSRPEEALERADAVLAQDPPPLHASVAHQAIGVVRRDRGDMGGAVTALRAALRLARAARSSRRVADVLATLGATLILAGRTVEGRRLLDDAAGMVTGAHEGQILMRRGNALRILGQHREAKEDLDRAVRLLARAHDTLWEPRALTARAFTALALGDSAAAAADLHRAELLLGTTDQELESATALHNRGVVAFRSGDLPAALTCMDGAAERFAKVGASFVEERMERCAVLLAAGLPLDALGETTAAIEQLDRAGGSPTERAELLLTAATCALAAGRPDRSRRFAVAAKRLFAGQRRDWWREHARLQELRARVAGGEAGPAVRRQAQRCALALDGLSSPDADLAHLLAGHLALTQGRPADAERHLASAARGRYRGPAVARTVGWLAEALRAEAVGDGRRLLHACRRGLRVLDEHRDTLGSSELRAQVTLHGSVLAQLAQRQALRHGTARLLLVWSERWRGSALAVPPVLAPDDAALRADLAAVREITSRLDRGGGPATLRREQLRLERSIRSRALRTPGAGTSTTRPFDVRALLDELGTDRLLQLVDVDGRLHVLVCGGGQVRRYTAGRTVDAAREVDLARSGLKRILRRPSGGAMDLLHAAAPLLSAALLGDARGHLGDGAVVVVPPGILHAAPWAMLPELRDRVVSVAPSASAWLRARHAPPAPSTRVVLVRGPDLDAGEIPELARRYPDATVLGDGTATAARVLDALDGADLAHVAAHGTFRADSPLFSSLQLDDGPLTVHDLEHLGRAPRRLVLPSCDSGLLVPAGADELLGLTASLLPLGTAGVIAGVVPIADGATAPLMTALHRHLAEGTTLAEALHRARPAPDAEPTALATSWSFIALGAG